MGDHIIRPMGAATLRIERDSRPNQMTVAIECDRGHCHSIASVSSDLAGVLGLEAAGQHFDCPAAATEWIRSRIKAISCMSRGIDGIGMARDWREHAGAPIQPSDFIRSSDAGHSHIQHAENTASALNFTIAEGGPSSSPPPSASL